MQALTRGKVAKTGREKAPQSSQRPQSRQVLSPLPCLLTSHLLAISSTPLRIKPQSLLYSPDPCEVLGLLLPSTSTSVLSSAAGGGGASCARSYPGRCKTHCNSMERSIFMCNRYKLCCVKDLLRTTSPPPVHKPKDACRKSARRRTKEHQRVITPEPLLFPGIQYGCGILTKG